MKIKCDNARKARSTMPGMWQAFSECLTVEKAGRTRRKRRAERRVPRDQRMGVQSRSVVVGQKDFLGAKMNQVKAGKS